MEHSDDILYSLISSNNKLGPADIFELKHYPAGFTFGPHQHPNIEINYVKSGSCRMLFAGKDWVTFRKNDCMIVFPGVKHYFEVGNKPASLVQLEFRMDIIDSNLSHPSLMHNLIFLYDVMHHARQYMRIVNYNPITELVKKIVIELQEEKPNYLALTRLYYAQLFIILSRYIKETLAHHHDLSNPLFQKAITYIHAHYIDIMSVSEIAAQLNISDRYLRKIFGQVAGISPVEYLRHLRIRKASQLMVDTKLSMKEIAAICGFASQQYMVRCFKNIMGVTPTLYRKENSKPFNF